MLSLFLGLQNRTAPTPMCYLPKIIKHEKLFSRFLSQHQTLEMPAYGISLFHGFKSVKAAFDALSLSQPSKTHDQQLDVVCAQISSKWVMRLTMFSLPPLQNLEIQCPCSLCSESSISGNTSSPCSLSAKSCFLYLYFNILKSEHMFFLLKILHKMDFELSCFLSERQNSRADCWCFPRLGLQNTKTPSSMFFLLKQPSKQHEGRACVLCPDFKTTHLLPGYLLYLNISQNSMEARHVSSVLTSNLHILSSCSLSFSPGLQKHRFRHIMLSLPQLQNLWLTANVFSGWTTSNTNLLSLDLLSLFSRNLQNLEIRQSMFFCLNITVRNIRLLHSSVG